MNKKKILFISHTAARTGAPISLLRFLKWFKSHTDIPFQILLQSGGELESEFNALAPVSVLYKESLPKKNLSARISHALGFQEVANAVYLKLLKKQLSHENIGLIYSNTATNGRALEFLSNLACPVISHVRELEYYIRYHIGAENFTQVMQYTHHYIAISKSVKSNLIKNHNIPEANIDLIYNFFPLPSQQSLAALQQGRDEIRKRLNLSGEALIVCASGTIDWRKGPDLFIHLARSVYQRQLKLPVYFLWIGGETSGKDFGRLCHDVRQLGMEEYIRFLGVQSNPLEYFAACDVFAMVSREEPFGLVCIEAASLGKPIVCFEGVGGAEEFVEDDCGYIVPYLDIEAMATKVVSLLDSPEHRYRSGQQAKAKVQKRHAITEGAPKILNVIKRFL